jgi:hypothetical protein
MSGVVVTGMFVVRYMNPPRVWAYAGPSVTRDTGWVLNIDLIPRPDLMGRGDEGNMVLVGLGLELLVQWPWHHVRRQALAALNGRTRWRWPVRVWLRSDAREIAARAGRLAGLSWRDLA